MADAKRDSNYITTLIAVSNADGVTPVVLYADPTTHRLLVDASGGGANTALSNLASVAINTALLPGTSDSIALGSATKMWSDLFLGDAATINFNNGNAVITHSAGILTVSTGDLRVTTAGTNAASVVTVGGTQTLTNKTLTSPTIGTSPTAAGATWPDLGTVTTVDINGGTIDGVTIGGASAGAITGTTITANTGFMPDANDGAYLGQAGTAFSDLFLASGAVINFDSSNMTITHSAGVLTIGGGTLALGANSLTLTGSIAATGARVTKGWFTDIESTNMPTVGGTAILTSLTAPQFTTIELGHASDTTLSRVSAGVVAIEGQNIIKANSTATRTIVLTAAGGWPSTTAGCADPAKSETTTNDMNYYTLDFDQTTEENAEWSVTMPDNYDGGTITAIFYWTAASGSGDVIWGIKGRAFANDDALDQAFGTAQTVTDTLITAGDMHITSATAACTLAGSPAGGQWVALKIYRDADAGGDTLNADAKLMAVKIEYGINAYSD